MMSFDVPMLSKRGEHSPILERLSNMQALPISSIANSRASDNNGQTIYTRNTFELRIYTILNG